mmetsp:Transcript_357/g.468  ORF Transcript_357/g.468 Transcript_357/m.468 type:complete len:124 (-) Transcript_357:83-454(-)
MASMGQAISSVTRPLRAAVKPGKFVAEHRLRATPLANDAARAALVAVPTMPAPAIPQSHGHDYVWGVKWPGHSIADQPNVDTEEVKKAFMRWHIFSLGGVELWSGLMMTATSVISSSLPGKKH